MSNSEPRQPIRKLTLALLLLLSTPEAGLAQMVPAFQAQLDLILLSAKVTANGRRVVLKGFMDEQVKRLHRTLPTPLRESWSQSQLEPLLDHLTATNRHQTVRNGLDWVERSAMKKAPLASFQGLVAESRVGRQLAAEGYQFTASTTARQNDLIKPLGRGRFGPGVQVKYYSDPKKIIFSILEDNRVEKFIIPPDTMVKGLQSGDFISIGERTVVPNPVRYPWWESKTNLREIVAADLPRAHSEAYAAEGQRMSRILRQAQLWERHGEYLRSLRNFTRTTRALTTETIALVRGEQALGRAGVTVATALARDVSREFVITRAVAGLGVQGTSLGTRLSSALRTADEHLALRQLFVAGHISFDQLVVGYARLAGQQIGMELGGEAGRRAGQALGNELASWAMREVGAIVGGSMGIVFGEAIGVHLAQSPSMIKFAMSPVGQILFPIAPWKLQLRMFFLEYGGAMNVAGAAVAVLPEAYSYLNGELSNWDFFKGMAHLGASFGGFSAGFYLGASSCAVLGHYGLVVGFGAGCLSAVGLGGFVKSAMDSLDEPGRVRELDLLISDQIDHLRLKQRLLANRQELRSRE